MILAAATLSGADATLAAAALPPCLVSPEVAGRIAGRAGGLPDGAACLILEMRLDAPGRAVDVSQAFVPGGLPGLARTARGVPALSGLWPFLDWAAEARPRAIWLEWDLGEGDPARQEGPGAFFALPDPVPDGIGDFVADGVAALGRGDLAGAVGQAIARVEGLARLRQLGVLPARPDGGVRLVLDIAGGAEAARAVIDRLAPAARADLEALLALPGFAGAERLDLDLLGPGRIGPRISLERPAASLTADGMRDCAEGLVRAGLAARELAAAMEKIAEWSVLDARLLAGLSHLKASAREGRVREVKVYQGFVPRPDAMAVRTSG